MKSRRGAGKTPRATVIANEMNMVSRVRIEGITTLVPSSVASVKNIRTITRI